MAIFNQASGARTAACPALALACVLSAVACGSDDSTASGDAGTADGGDNGGSADGGKNGDNNNNNNNGDGKDGGKNGDNNNGKDGGNVDGGNVDGGDNNDPGVARWIVGTWLWDPDSEYTTLLTVVDDLSNQGSADFDSAPQWPTDFTYSSNGEGKVFIGRADMPVIERWALDDDGELRMDGEPLGLDAYGVTNTLGRSQPVIQFIDEDRAYYVDMENFQVIVFNPSATPMTIYPEDTFSFDGLDVDEKTDDVTTVLRDGDRLILAARYWDEDSTIPSLVKAAIIDVTSDTVTYAEDTRCGSVGSAVFDEAGNVYFGSHGALPAWAAAGNADDDTPPACIVRIKKGENKFDPDYFVNLDEISGGIAGSLQQGADNHAYVMQYTSDIEITAENYRGQLRGANWEVHVLDLGDAENTYAKVEGLPKMSGYGASFTTTVGHERVPFFISYDTEEGGGRYLDVSDPTSPKNGLEIPLGTPGSALPL